jgi:hypothetical protein
MFFTAFLCCSCGASTRMEDNPRLDVECSEDSVEVTVIVYIDQNEEFIDVHDSHDNNVSSDVMEYSRWYWWNMGMEIGGVHQEYANRIEIRFLFPREEIYMSDITIYLDMGELNYAWFPYETIRINEDFEIWGNGNIEIFCN